MSKKKYRPKLTLPNTDTTENELKSALMALTEKNPEKVKDILDIINNQTIKIDEQTKVNRKFAKRTSMFATALSGAVSAGLVAAIAIPSIPEVAIIGAIAGFIGSRYAAKKIDKYSMQHSLKSDLSANEVGRE